MYNTGDGGGGAVLSCVLDTASVSIQSGSGHHKEHVPDNRTHTMVIIPLVVR